MHLPTHLPKENLIRLYHIYARQIQLNSLNSVNFVFLHFCKNIVIFLLHFWPWLKAITTFYNPTLSAHSCVLIRQKQISLNNIFLWNTEYIVLFCFFYFLLILVQLIKSSILRTLRITTHSMIIIGTFEYIIFYLSELECQDNIQGSSCEE